MPNQEEDLFGNKKYFIRKLYLTDQFYNGIPFFKVRFFFEFFILKDCNCLLNVEWKGYFNGGVEFTINSENKIITL